MHTHTHPLTPCSGRILTLSEHTPVINLSVSSGESLQLAPPFPAVQGWQWVSGEVGVSGAEGGSGTVELTVPVLDSGQDVVIGNTLALFDDLSVDFVGWYRTSPLLSCCLY